MVDWRIVPYLLITEESTKSQRKVRRISPIAKDICRPSKEVQKPGRNEEFI